MNRHPLASATALMTSAALLFGVMAILAKGAAARLPGPQIAFVRFMRRPRRLRAGGDALPPARAQLARPVLARRVRRRARCSATSWPSSTSPSAWRRLLNYTAPVFTALWAWLFLGERIALGTVGALAMTTTGVAVVIVANAPPGTVALGPWQCVGILSSVLSGAAVATIREVRKTDGAWEIFCAFCIAGAIFTGVPASRHCDDADGARVDLARSASA